MAQVERMTLEMDVIAKVDGAIGGINKIKSTLQGIKMPPKLGADLEKSFSNLSGLFEKYKDQVKNGFNTKGDVSSFAKTAKQIDNEVDRLSKNLHKLTGEKITLNIETDRLKSAQNELTKLIAQKEKLMSDVKGSFGLGEYFDAFRKVSGGRNTKVFGAANILQTSLERGNLTKALEDIKALEAAYNKMKDTKQAAFQDKTGVTGSAAITQLRNKVEEAIRSQTTYNQKIETTRQELENIPTQMMNDAGKLAEQAAQGMDKLASETKQVTASSTEAARATQSMSQQLQDLQHSTQYFFSLRNMINLFRRGIQDAVQSVKELDAAMTDTAVVTDYKVSDLWGMLPEYTKIANELGATTQGAYETMTLYFQQGLDQQQAFEIGAETMKMARIAGLEYAEATDMMTAALRGFNMELNETSAQRINDVYSKLAAVTASDTEELGTAMQRTASIAHSAGMSFEGTTAFLAQAIETTREPAENLGTAMKTIIARFQEMKKNPLEMVEVDGEEVSYNKVDEALQSIGVSLKDTNGQFRELDQVFLDISQRWDGLTQTQQRYIATIAAGSRQQSRFIAMMSNYGRTVELMDAANNSAGASEEQFGKTMDSLEAKLNQLHNAWQAFTMGIANNGMIKFAVDGVTSLLTVTNNLINALSLGSPVLKSFLSLFTAFTGLKVAGKFANSLIGGLGGLIDPQSGFFRGFFGGAAGNRAGANAAQAYAISNPIVQAINNQTAALGGKITSNGNPQVANNSNVPNFKDYTNALTGFRNLSRQAGKTSIQDVFGSLSGINGKQQSMILSSQQGTMRAINAGMKDLFKSKNLREESQKFGMKMADGITTGLNKGNIIGADLAKMIGSKNLYEIAESAGPDVAQAYTQAIQAELENNQTSIYDAAEKLWHQKARGGDAGYTLEQAVKDAKAQHLEKWAENFDLSQYMTPTLTKGQQLQNTINSLGSGITTTGQAFTTFGMILNNLGLQGVGSAFLSLGSIISNVGMTISSVGNAFPTLFKKIGEGQKLFGALKSSIAEAGLSGFMGALGGAAIAGVAIAAVVKIHKAIEKRAKDNAEKVTKTYEDAINQSTEKISALTSAKDTFAELSKGIDQYGNNISLTQDEYDEYLKTSREIADLAPELIRGYDAQGNAIIATGAAIDELIKKQEELQESAKNTFIDNTSINDLVKGIQVSDTFKKNNQKQSIYDPITKQYKTIPKQVANLERSLAKAGINNFDEISKQLFGKEINLINPSQDDLRLLSEHYTDILNLIDSENKQLTEKQREGLQDAFIGLGEGWNAMLEEAQPLSKAIGQYLSSKGLDTIGLNLGEEFTESFNKGLESLTMTAAMEGWDASKIKEEARGYAEGFKAMVQEGSEYANIMEKVTAEQEKYNDSIGNPGAISDYKNAVEGYANELEVLANKYDDGTIKGQLFANSLRETANHIRNYATENIISLGEALNTLADDFESARGAEERFKKATEKGDYYTAAEGYQNIAKTVLDEKNSAGNGSLTGWAGAEELLGEKFVDSHTWKEIEAKVQKIAPMFDDGIEGVQKFGDFLIEAAGESGKELKGLGEVIDGEFKFDFDPDDLDKFADKLGIAKDALVALIDKSRQFAPWDVSDPSKVKQALMGEGTSMSGTSSKGEDLIYTSESHFKTEAKQQGIRGDDYKKTKAEVEKEGVRFLTVENLTAKNQKDGGTYANQVLENIGLKGADKTLDNAVAAFTKMGFSLEDTKQILTADGIKLADGTATEEQIAQAYNEQAYALENPTVSGIADDTGVIANAATALLASMGILTDEAKQDIKDNTSEESIKAQTDKLSPKEGFTNSTDRNSARQQVQAKIDDNNATIGLLKQGLNEDNKAQIQPLIDDLEAANKQLQDSLDNEEEIWKNKISEAYKSLEGIGTEAEQEYLQANAVDIASIVNQEDLLNAASALRQLEDEGNLTHSTMAQLAADFLQFRQNDLVQLDSTQLDQLATKLGLTCTEATELFDILQIPFSLEGRIEGEDLEEYINNFEGLTDTEKSILLTADTSGEEKVTALIDEIDKEFGDETEEKKTVILEAEAKLAGGDQEGAKKILADAGFNENQVQEIVQKLSITVNGTVANKDEVQSSLNSQLEGMNLSAEAKAKVSAKLDIQGQKANLNQTGTINYKSKVDQGAITQAKNTAAKGADMPIKAVDKASSTIQNIRSKAGKSVSFDVSPNFTGTWTKILTIKSKKTGEQDARGRNFSIPASQSISFGSAARGMNLPKKKKSSKNQVTALVGEEGFEVGYIPSEQRSVIFGANGPEMTSFPSDTIIYPHDISEEILRRGKQKTLEFGSFVTGSISGSGGGGSSKKSTRKKKGKKGKKGKKSKSKSKSKSSSKDPTLNLFSIQEVVRFNIDQAISDLNADIEKREKEIEKGLSKIGASYKSISGVTKKQIGALKQIQTKNQQLLASYQAQLKEYRGQEAYVKWTTNSGESKNKKIKIKDYLNADGSVNQAAISKLGSRAEREAVFKEVSSAKSLVDGIQKAQDEIDKAGDQIEELGKKITEQFFLWENELTKIYNLTQKINNLNSLSERFASQIALETAKLGAGFGSLSKSIDTIRKVTVRNNDTIGKQIAVQQQMISARQEEMENILRAVNEAKDLEAAWRDNKSDAATKKARVNAAKDNYNAAKIGYGYLKNLKQDLDGSLSYDINWSQIAKDRTSGKLSKDTYDMVKSYLDNLNDSVTEFNDSIKTQTDTIKDLYEQYTQYQETINDFGETLLNGLEAIQKEREDDLKKMSTLVSGLGDGMKDLIDQVKRNLDERRKQEDNRKTEADISKKQQRLAALQADTSGGHQVEIAQLQKEIGETQQNYQRTLEDQLLDRLQAQNDEAIKQRERLISISEAQLAIAAQNNTELVNLWLKNPEAYKSKIYDAYREAIDFSEKLDIGKQLAKQDFNSQFASVVTAVDQIKIPNHANALTQINSNITNLRGILTQQNSSKTSAQAKVTAKNTGSTATKPTAKATTPKVATPVAPKKAAPKKAAAPAKKAAPVPKVKTQAEKDAELWEKIKTNFGNLSIDATKAKAGGLGSDALRVAKTHKGDKVYIKGQDAHVGASGEIYWDRKGTIRKWNPSTGQVVKQKYNKKQYIKEANPKNSPYVYEEYRESLRYHKVKGYKTGGLASETGPAYLHGTPSKPELVLNAQDTKNFIALKDVLSKAVHSSNFASTSYGDATYEININVDKISSDYDVDKMAERVKKIIVSDSSYRNVTQVRKFR